MTYASIRIPSRKVRVASCCDPQPLICGSVYSPDMPERLPTFLLLQQISRQAFSTATFSLRVAVVAIVWLAMVPWATIWTWRMYFTFGNSTCVLRSLVLYRLFL